LGVPLPRHRCREIAPEGVAGALAWSRAELPRRIMGVARINGERCLFSTLRCRVRRHARAVPRRGNTAVG
jgi:hypothetical protein